MASVLLSPIGNGQQFFDNNGVPLAGGLLYTYQAGSSTPLATYADNGGTIPNPNPIVLNSSGRSPTEIWMFTGYSYKLVLQTAANVTLQTLDNIYPILQNAPASAPSVPSGMIMLWSGSTGSVPSGWQLCDGTNGSPDLRNSFIVGAGNTYSVGATGGTADAIVVAHTHAINDPGHAHTVFVGTSAINGSTNNVTASPPGGNNNNLPTSTVTTGITNATTGVSGTGQNLPPYYALAYVIKL